MVAEQVGDGLHSAGGIAWLIAFWSGFWFATHHLFWPFWNYRRVHALMFTPTSLDVYRRRLCRSQVYCVLAVVGGVRVLARCKELPHDLLYGFSEEHQVLFSMAIGHWLVSVWEDSASAVFLQAGLRAADLSGSGLPVSTPGAFLETAYIWHHVIAALGYLGILCMQACTAVGSFGLIFELPVLFLNHREFMAFADKPPRWFCDADKVQRYWMVTHVVFSLARGGPTLVYVYSLCFWQADLNKLGLLETIVYHFMALFFTILNFNYQNKFLKAWAKRDQDIARHGLGGTLAAAFDVELNSNKEPPVPINEDVQQLLAIPGEIIGMKNGTPGPDGEPPEYWLSIDNIAYNVTSFMKEHPGGEAVMRKYAGQDASEAFKRVKHSVSAKIKMSQLAVGPIIGDTKDYRIFEHVDLLIFAFWEFISVSFVYGGASILLGNSNYVRPQVGLDFAAIVLPGLVLTGAISGLTGAVLLCIDPVVWAKWPGLEAHVMAWHMILHHVGLVLVRRPLPSSVQEACPTGLELTVASLFLFQDLLEHSVRVSPAVLLACGGVLASWAMRGADELLDASGGSHTIVGALLLAYSISWLTRRISDGESRKDMAANIILAVVISGFYAMPVLYGLTLMSPAAWEVLESYWADSMLDLIGLMVTAGVLAFGLIMVMNNAFVCSPPWAARLCAGIYGIGVIFAGGLWNFRWLAVAAFFSQLGALGARNRLQLKEAKKQGKFGEVESFKIGTQALWDQLRTFVLTLTWRFTIQPANALINRLLPEELCVYSCEIPIFELGSGVDLGVAAIFTPERRKAELPQAGNGHVEDGQQKGSPEDEKQGKPDFFVCNVGHIDNTHEAGLSDLQRTMNALRDIWMEFKRPDVKGLVANCVCVFPHVEGTSFSKEINLSAWTSAQEAHDWYAKSPGHRNTMLEHSGGRLRTFGNLLASLRPVGKIRHQDRCKRCARLVEAPKLGDRAPEWCSACGAPTFGYPFF